AAFETLGEIIEEGGNRGAAGKEFLQAIESDPHNAIAYLRYSRTLRNREESRIYAQVGRQLEPSSVAEISDGRIKISQPPPLISEEKIVPTPSESDHGERKTQASGVLSVTQLEFSNVDPSRTKSVVFTNTGPGSLKISSVAVQGHATVFRVTRDDCS